MQDRALMVADVLGPGSRDLVLGLSTNEPVLVQHKDGAAAWPLDGRPPTAGELARLRALIDARSTIAGTELTLTPLGRTVANVLTTEHS